MGLFDRLTLIFLLGLGAALVSPALALGKHPGPSLNIEIDQGIADIDPAVLPKEICNQDRTTSRFTPIEAQSDLHPQWSVWKKQITRRYESLRDKIGRPHSDRPAHLIRLSANGNTLDVTSASWSPWMVQDTSIVDHELAHLIFDDMLEGTKDQSTWVGDSKNLLWGLYFSESLPDMATFISTNSWVLGRNFSFPLPLNIDEVSEFSGLKRQLEYSRSLGSCSFDRENEKIGSILRSDLYKQTPSNHIAGLSLNSFLFKAAHILDMNEVHLYHRWLATIAEALPLKTSYFEVQERWQETLRLKQRLYILNPLSVMTLFNNGLSAEKRKLFVELQEQMGWTDENVRTVLTAVYSPPSQGWGRFTVFTIE